MTQKITCFHQLLANKKSQFHYRTGFVPKKGLEPPRPKAHAPETCTSTNFATSAFPMTIEINRNRKEEFCGTGGGTRTRTLLPILDFESSASTDSATPAVPNLEPMIEKMDSLTRFRSAVGKCRKVFFYAQEVSLF